MTDPLSASTDDVRVAGAGLGDASSRLKRIFDTLNANLSAIGPAWGDDSMGDQFANGPDGFVSQLGDVNSAIDAKTKLLDEYGDALTGTANDFDANG